MTAGQGSLGLQSANGDQTLFVDGGVYTRNRAFRLFLSSKAGKDAVLQLTGLLRFRQYHSKHVQMPEGDVCMPSTASA